MKLPYLQVAQETWTKASALSAVLGISRREAFGLISDLWKWSLDLGPKDETPTGEVNSPRATQILAKAMEWPGEAEVLVDALCDGAIGLVEKTSNGLRVKGTDRYAGAWKRKNRPGPSKRAPSADLGNSSAESPQKSAAVSADDCGLLPLPSSSLVLSSSPPPAAARQDAQPPLTREEPKEPLSEAMEGVFLLLRKAKYRWTQADGAALRLIVMEDHPEILRRWAIGLEWRGFPTCSSVVDLQKFWNHYAAKQSSGKPKDARTGTTWVEDQDWSGDGGYGALNGTKGPSHG